MYEAANSVKWEACWLQHCKAGMKQPGGQKGEGV